LKIQKNNDVFPLAAEIKRQYKSNEEECNWRCLVQNLQQPANLHEEDADHIMSGC
jgi:hypothetical protein